MSSINNDDAKVKAIDDNAIIDNALITINIGGTLFKCNKSTLNKSEYFKAIMLSDKDCSDFSNVYIDRDPAVFSSILSLLRKSPGSMFDSVDSNQLLSYESDINYYQFNVLLDKCEKARKDYIDSLEGDRYQLAVAARFFTSFGRSEHMTVMFLVQRMHKILTEQSQASFKRDYQTCYNQNRVPDIESAVLGLDLNNQTDRIKLKKLQHAVDECNRYRIH